MSEALFHCVNSAWNVPSTHQPCGPQHSQAAMKVNLKWNGAKDKLSSMFVTPDFCFLLTTVQLLGFLLHETERRRSRKDQEERSFVLHWRLSSLPEETPWSGNLTRTNNEVKVRTGKFSNQHATCIKLKGHPTLLHSAALLLRVSLTQTRGQWPFRLASARAMKRGCLVWL